MRYLMMASLLFLLSACSAPVPVLSSHNVCCANEEQRQDFASTLESAGIQISQVGDNVSVILPTGKFFYNNSSHLDKASYPTLDTLIKFLNTYPMTAMQLSGYTNNQGDALRNLALSRQQAQIITYYLWTHGLNARLISAEGNGAKMPAVNQKASGENNRIEINFRMPPPDNVFN